MATCNCIHAVLLDHDGQPCEAKMYRDGRKRDSRMEAEVVALRSKVERYEDALRCVEHWARNADLTPAQFWAVDRLTHEVLHHAAALSNPTATTEEP